MRRSTSWEGRSGALMLCLAAAASMTPTRSAEAFCGFYVSSADARLVNRATRVSLMRDGVRTVLAMSNDYEGPPEDFAMVVPVPVVLHQANVRTLPVDVFEHLEGLTAPRLVEYWEQDPCEDVGVTRPVARGLMGRRDARPARYAIGGGAVRVEARFEVGEYDVVVLSASESHALERWLRENHYNIPTGAADALAPYVREQWKFFVARVAYARVRRRPDGGARLSPLRFHYDSQEFRLPVRLGLLNTSGAQDLLVYVLHPRSRFEVANYPNVFIPTNLDVDEGARDGFSQAYERLFEDAIGSVGRGAVVTEYAWTTRSCDPCATPPLSRSDLVTLGADVLYEGLPGVDPRVPYEMTVTRLHARYSSTSLSEDLVFREAGPVVGGRENVVDEAGHLESGARHDATVNAFQARYAIRHLWEGSITCTHPVRGRWGDPPEGAAPTTRVALNPGSPTTNRAAPPTFRAFAPPVMPPRERDEFMAVFAERRASHKKMAFSAVLGALLGALLTALTLRLRRRTPGADRPSSSPRADETPKRLRP